MQNSDINFSIKNRLLDLICKLISVKTIWAIIITVVFITIGTTVGLTAPMWLTFVGSLIGINSVDKFVRKLSGNKKTIVSNEAD